MGQKDMKSVYAIAGLLNEAFNTPGRIGAVFDVLDASTSMAKRLYEQDHPGKHYDRAAARTRDSYWRKAIKMLQDLQDDGRP